MKGRAATDERITQSGGATRLVTSPTVRRRTDDATTAIGANRSGGIRLLVFTGLYPNSEQPCHGLFVEERLRKLVATGRVSATVVAPVPWFPFRHRRFGAYAAFARVPAHEDRHGIRIQHPRYPVIPKIGMNVAAKLMFRALLPVIRDQVGRQCSFDLIDAHYFYPDGVAAMRLGEALDKPVVITARGSDVNVIQAYAAPRRQMRWAGGRADAIVAVSEALKDSIGACGIDSARVVVLRNGVDLGVFRPLDRNTIREKLGLTGFVWLAAGHLVELKGVHITLAALAMLHGVTLVIAGEGPERAPLQDLAHRLGIAARVRFLGSVPRTMLCEYYNAADTMVLASSHEGMPNVVLESLACGTPGILAPFASARELICAPEAGEIAESRTPDAIVAAWRRLVDRGFDRVATRRFAEQFGWGPVVDGQCALYEQVLAAYRTAHGTLRA